MERAINFWVSTTRTYSNAEIFFTHDSAKAINYGGGFRKSLEFLLLRESRKKFFPGPIIELF